MPETVENFKLLPDENLKDNDTDHEFEEKTDDERLMVSNDDRVAMEIVERTIKRIDQYKFQIAVSFRHINPNMQNNFVQAEARLYRQRRVLCKNSDARSKYMEKNQTPERQRLY